MTQYLYLIFFPPEPRRWYTRCHRAILWMSALWEPTLIRKVWSFNWKNMPWQESSRFEDYWVCQYQCESLLYKNMRWIKKSVFNLNCSSVLHVFKLSIDYEELWKETNQIPAFIIRCQGPNFSYIDLWWLRNFDFNFINHSNLKEDIWELVSKRKLQLSYPRKHFTFRPPNTFLRKNNVSSRNLKLPTRKH